MAGGKFDAEVFFRTTEAVATVVDESDLFGFLQRTIDVPVGCAALVTRTTGARTVVGAGRAIEGDDVAEVMFVRTTPLDVRFDVRDVTTRDRFACRVEVGLRVAVIAERGELISLQRVLMGSRRVAAIPAIVRHLEPVVRGALVTYASGHDAAGLVDGGGGDDVAAAVSDAIGPACFASGLVLDGPPVVVFSSATLARVRRTEQEAIRSRVEQDARRQLEAARERAQRDHLDHVTSLLDRLTELAGASPDAGLDDLIRTFSERERGELYGALFASQTPTTRTRWIVVAAGVELLLFDPRHVEAPARRLRIDGPAGAVRSVQASGSGSDSSALLVGAATGVYRVPIDAGAPDATWVVGDAPAVRGGFNAAVCVGARVFATHSELGVCAWDVGSGTSATRRLASMTAGAKAVRNIQFHDGDLCCSIDDRVVRWRADDDGATPTGIYAGGDTITAVLVTRGGVVAGTSDGRVLRWRVDGDAGAPEVVHAGSRRAVESLWVLRGGGVDQLVFSDTSLCVHARVMGDTFACRYEAGGQTLRRVEVAPDVIVATNDLRDRLICWSPGSPERPSAVIEVARLCGRSVQDVCLVGEASRS